MVTRRDSCICSKRCIQDRGKRLHIVVSGDTHREFRYSRTSKVVGMRIGMAAGRSVYVRRYTKYRQIREILNSFYANRCMSVTYFFFRIILVNLRESVRSTDLPEVYLQVFCNVHNIPRRTTGLLHIADYACQ